MLRTDQPGSPPIGYASAATDAATDAAGTARMPVRAWLALAIMLATVAGAGYLMYQRLFGGAADSPHLVDIMPMRGIAANFGQPPIQADGVRELGSNNYQIKAGDARVNVRRTKADDPWTFNFTYVRRDLITPEQDVALIARWRLPRDPAFAKALNVTPEQIKQLEALPGREGMIVADADRARVASLFEAYLQAAPPRDAQTAALVDALREIGERSLQPTRVALADRAAKIQAVLTPEQLAKFRRPGN
jgi:hypothetical protein